MIGQEHCLRSARKSGTLVSNELIQKRRQQNLPTYAFGFGQSPFPPLPRVIDALREHAAQKYYAPVQGIAALRESLAAFHEAAEGIKVPASRVLVGDGSKNLLFTVMQAFKNANVFIPAPAWVSYAPQATLAGHPAIPVSTTFEDRWRVTPEAMESALARRAARSAPNLLVLNHPGNPDGLGYTAVQLRALSEVFRKHNVIVLSDEIYGLLHHKGEHRSVALYYPEGNCSPLCGSVTQA